MPKLSIVVINYNGASFLSHCLDSVISQKSFFSDFDIHVLDNASTDESESVLNEYKDTIHLIQNQKNTGYAPAVNQVLSHINSQYIWLLNNDTEFDHSVDIFNPIINYLDSHSDVVGLSPKLLNTDGSLQSQGSMFNQWVFKGRATRSVSFLSGAAIFIRTDFFKRIGGFDAQLFFYNDDIDFAKQVKKHRKQLIYFPKILITHHGGLSTKTKPVQSLIAGYFGSIHLCHKFYPKPIFLIYLWIMKLFLLLKYFYHITVRDENYREWIREITQLKIKIKNEF